MQTFLPYASFEQSARCLDTKRLGKQRVEAYQILQTLLGERSGWRNHPAVRMRQGCEHALFDYTLAMMREWQRRGFRNDKMIENITNIWARLDHSAVDVPAYPAWFGDARFHASHRSNLLRKCSAHYARFGWTESQDMEYVWLNEEQGE